MPAMLSNVGTALKTASAAATVGLPTGLRVNQILIMHANVSSGTISITANSTGWVLLGQLTNAATNAVESYVWAMRVTDIAMGAPELTRTAGDYMIARIWTLSGAWEGGAVTDALCGSRETNSGAGVFTLSHTTFNTTQDDATIVYIGQTGFDGTGSDMTLGDIDHSAAAVGWYPAPIAVDGTTTGNGGGYAVAMAYKPFAGATGQLDWSHGSARSWCKHSYAFRGRAQQGEIASARIESAEVVYAPALVVDGGTIRPARIESAEAVYGFHVEASDGVPPTITVISPAGNALRPETVITIDVEDESSIAYAGILASYPDGTADVVYDGFEFGPNFQGALNTVTSLDGGDRLRFTLRRDDNWHLAPTFHPIVVDGGGNLGEV